MFVYKPTISGDGWLVAIYTQIVPVSNLQVWNEQNYLKIRLYN
ncbi:cytochrome b [Sporosarcina newyorkensis 2681]|uniref:Cytochrome b n=1 Tax=Sporosarcina newyorkensis 2681 TaxID=1027292 RepID=F9DWI2_9BACL|nr:cytochrome b [Sporosarcina newyorkensis 2681]